MLHYYKALASFRSRNLDLSKWCLEKKLCSGYYYAQSSKERWLSGRKRVPAKDVYPYKGTEGSNPSLSAFASSGCCCLRLFFIFYFFQNAKRSEKAYAMPATRAMVAPAGQSRWNERYMPATQKAMLNSMLMPIMRESLFV